MSEEQLKAFIAKVQEDTSLQEQLKTEGADHIAIAKAAGFVITEAEVNDLSDDELESVAGGGKGRGSHDDYSYGGCPTQSKYNGGRC